MVAAVGWAEDEAGVAGDGRRAWAAGEAAGVRRADEGAARVVAVGFMRMAG